MISQTADSGITSTPRQAVELTNPSGQKRPLTVQPRDHRSVHLFHICSVSIFLPSCYISIQFFMFLSVLRIFNKLFNTNLLQVRLITFKTNGEDTTININS